MADSGKRQRVTEGLQKFLTTDLDEALAAQAIAPADRAIQLFQQVAREVPAYAKFLAARGVTPSSVQTAAAFAGLPATNKAEYHQAYPLEELCRGGELTSSDFFAVSSGSSGVPTFWPRFVADEFSTAFRFEQVLRDGFCSHRRRTLGVVCFALGSWVGGMFTTMACRHLAAKGYPLMLVTPGNQRAEILRVVRALGDKFEQIVLFGYPPFLKDVIDAGRADALDWSKYDVRLVTAGEVFSEEWRSLVTERLGRADPVLRVASLYGTADGGVLANETPISIAIRRVLAQQPELAREVFGEPRLPTLCQYDPHHRYFETDGSDLLFSGDAGIPLIRYRILDRGGLYAFDDLLQRLQRAGFDPLRELPAAQPVRPQPFVYVFGRIGFALSFYGANIYPENVSVALERAELAPYVTGKFVLELASQSDHDVALKLSVELAAGAQASEALAQDIARVVRFELERLNSEFLNYTPAERRNPVIRLLPLGDPQYFPIGVKHRYTRS